MNEVETERLILRMWNDDDVDALFRSYGDPEVMKWIGSGEPVTKEVTADAIDRMRRHWEEHGYGMWAVVEKSSGDLIGRIGLMYHKDWPVGDHKIEVGWTLQRSAWGRGLATEGARAALDHGFDRLHLERIISITSEDNLASRRVMEKCGLSHRGRARWRGHDVIWYAIDRARRRAVGEQARSA